MKTLNKILDFFEVKVCNVLFIAMVLIVVIQIVLRTAGLPLAWTEETARYFFVWIVYLSASRALSLGSHLSVDIITLLIKKERGKAILQLFVDAVIGFFLLVVLINGSKLLRNMSITPQYSAAVHYNMIFPYSAPVVGSALLILRLFEKVVKDINDVIHPADTEGSKEEVSA